jgi:hypothetical protein
VSHDIDQRDPEADEVPLAEAVRRFVDLLLLQRHDELAARIASWPRPGTERYRQGWPDEDPRRHQYVAGLRAPVREAQAAAHKEMMNDLCRQLLDDRLIASGLALPLTPVSRRTDIAPRLWEVLTLRPGAGEAIGKGLHITEVRIRRPKQPRTAEGRDGAIGQALRRPGPKSIMPQIAAEMRARAERGELKVGIAEECRALEKWVKANHPEHPRPPKDKSIQNTLGKLYYELKAVTASQV